MKSAEELLKAYESKNSVSPSATAEHIDCESRLVLIWAIYDFRSGEWVHDFLVEEGHLKDPEDANARLTQVRKVQRWRARMEEELGLPPRGRGGVTATYRAKRRKWESVNPRPTTAQLLAGWAPKKVDYEEFRQELVPARAAASTDMVPSGNSDPEPRGNRESNWSADENRTNLFDAEEKKPPKNGRKKIKLPDLGLDAFKQQKPEPLEIHVSHPR
jgi:hypothetical protein